MPGKAGDRKDSGEGPEMTPGKVWRRPGKTVFSRPRHRADRRRVTGGRRESALFQKKREGKMKAGKIVAPALVAAFIFVMAAGVAGAQERPRRPEREAGERPERPERGERGGMQPEEIRQRMEEARQRREAGERPGIQGEGILQRMSERMRTQLGASEEEWQVLGPAVEKVTRLRASAAARGAARQRRGEGQGEGEAELTAVQAARRELESALADEATAPETIAARLAALRQAREKESRELEAARGELRELLTARQEARLVLMGILE